MPVQSIIGARQRSVKGAQRIAGARRKASILLTNPDMLHLGILPNPTLWADFLANLPFVILGEAHVYRRVFGSHMGCVLRRLWRVCARYGAAPQIVACSATIANPGEHLQRLAGVEAVVVDEDGAPGSARDFVLWNPPFVDRARTARLFARPGLKGLLLSFAVVSVLRGMVGALITPIFLTWTSSDELGLILAVAGDM